MVRVSHPATLGDCRVGHRARRPHSLQVLTPGARSLDSYEPDDAEVGVDFDVGAVRDPGGGAVRTDHRKDAELACDDGPWHIAPPSSTTSAPRTGSNELIHGPVNGATSTSPGSSWSKVSIRSCTTQARPRYVPSPIRSHGGTDVAVSAGAMPSVRGCAGVGQRRGWPSWRPWPGPSPAAVPRAAEGLRARRARGGGAASTRSRCALAPRARQRTAPGRLEAGGRARRGTAPPRHRPRARDLCQPVGGPPPAGRVRSSPPGQFQQRPRMSSRWRCPSARLGEQVVEQCSLVGGTRSRTAASSGTSTAG